MTRFSRTWIRRRNGNQVINGRIQRISTNRFHSVLDVKTKGLQILLDAVDVKSLDFLLLTSSIVTITGSDGNDVVSHVNSDL